MGRHIVFAILFSLLVPGLGQIYNQDLTKGLLFIIGSVLGLLFFGAGYLVLWLWAIIDAYVRARSLGNQPA